MTSLIWGEALYKDPERPIHSEQVWRKYHVQRSFAAILGLSRPPIILHNALYIASGKGREVDRKGKSHICLILVAQ